MTSFSCHMVFKFAYFLELSKGYQTSKFQCCRLSGSTFKEGLQKHDNDVISYFWDLKFLYFVKLIISCQHAKFQIPQLSESNFTEVGIRHRKKPLWRHYDVTSQYLVFEMAHFVELNRTYQPAKFH